MTVSVQCSLSHQLPPQLFLPQHISHALPLQESDRSPGKVIIIDVSRLLTAMDTDRYIQKAM